MIETRPWLGRIERRRNGLWPRPRTDGSAVGVVRGLRIFTPVIVIGMLTGITTVTGAPALDCPTADWDVGQVCEGATVFRTFPVRNTGDQILVIERVESSCPECTVGLDENKQIEPGKSASLVVVYEARNNPGQHAVTLTIHSNDPANPARKVTLRATIVPAEGKPRIELTPQAFDLGVIPMGQPRSLGLTVTNPATAKGPLVVKGLDSRGGVRSQAKPPLEVQPGKAEVIRFEVQGKDLGILNEFVSITSNDPVRPIVSVPITGYVVEATEKDGQSVGREIPGRIPRGMRIESAGESVAIPGTGAQFFQELLVENRTGATVRVEFPAADASLAEAEEKAIVLQPGQSRKLRLKVKVEQIGKAESLRIQVDYPVLLKEKEDGR